MDVLDQDVAHLHLNESLVTCAPTNTIREVAQILNDKKVGSILIQWQGYPVGIFTERDLIRCVADTSLDLQTEIVQKHMTPDPKSVLRTTPLSKVMILMRIGKFRHLLIKDEAGVVVGVISMRDVLNHIVDAVHA